jgi:nitrogen fixation negative regulator NifL
MMRFLAGPRRFLVDFPLRPTIAGALILGLTLPAVFSVWRNLSERRETLLHDLAEDHASIVEIVAIGMQTPLWELRPDTARPLVDAVMRDERVISVSVTSQLIPEFLFAAAPERDGADVIIREAPVTRADEQIGTVRVEMSKAHLAAEVARQGRQAVLTGLLQLALGLLLLMPLLRLKVLQPIRQLLGQSQALAAGEWAQPFAWRRADELGSLGRSFETTRQSLAGLFGDLEERNQDLAKREAELASQAAILRATLDNMTDGICLFDEELRMRICNQRFVEIMQFPPEIVREGTPLEAMIRFDIEHGLLKVPDPKGYVEQALARYRTDAASETLLERGGAVLRLRRRPVADGGFVTTYADITDQKRHEERLALLATAVEQEGDSVELADADYRLIYVNPAFTTLTGYRREEALGRTPAQLVRSDQHDAAFFDEVHDTLQRGEVWQGRLISRHKDGRLLYQDATISPVFDPDGRLTHYVAVKRDVAEQVRAAEALRASEQRFRTIAEGHPVPMIIARLSDQAPLFANAAFCELFQLDETDAPLRRLASHYVDPEDRNEVFRLVREHGRLDGHELMLRRTDGTVFPASLVSRLMEYQGEPAVVSSFTDLTDKKRAEAEIARQREALHQSEKLSALGTLLAGVAHELNNPLSVVVGQAALLSELSADEATRARAEKIRTAADRCARIVRTFLSMARSRPVKRGPVDVNSLVEAALELLGYGLRTADVTVILDLALDLPPVWGESDQLHQVLTNLIINAQQATQEIEPPRELRISTRREGSTVRLDVVDNGPGIDPELAKRVFEPFFTTKPGGLGTGIGLSVCHGIIQGHEGSIELSSAPGGGASFVIRLPLASQDRRSPADEAEGADPSPRGHVLVVDDEPDVAELFAEVLRHSGHEVSVAASGREALDLLGQAKVDVIVSDLRMPDVDGPALHRALASISPGLVARLIFITGDALSHQAEQFLAESGADVLEKPVDPQQLVSRVHAKLAALG